MRILFVCDDNRVVSPLAAGLLYHESRRRQIDQLVVASAGFGPAGVRIDPTVSALMQDRLVDLSRKRTRRLADLVERADAVLAMTAEQAARAIKDHPDRADRVFVLGHLVAVLTRRPIDMSPSAWLGLVRRTTDLATPDNAVNYDLAIAEPVGIGPIMDVADQLIAATDRIVDCLWEPVRTTSGDAAPRRPKAAG